MYNPKIYKKLEKLIKFTYPYGLDFNYKENRFSFETTSAPDITFDNLLHLSETFKTKKIDITSDGRETDGYYPSNTSVIGIAIKDVTWPQEIVDLMEK